MSDDGKMSDEADLHGEEDASESDNEDAEEGEFEMSDMEEGEFDMEEEDDEESSDEMVKAAEIPTKRQKLDDGYEFVRDDGQEIATAGKDSKKEDKEGAKAKKEDKDAAEVEQPERKYIDRYRIDPLLVRREASLIVLCLKAFRKRCIVFVNEKK